MVCMSVIPSPPLDFGRQTSSQMGLAVRPRAGGSTCAEEGPALSIKSINDTFRQKNGAHSIDRETRKDRAHKHFSATLVKEAATPSRKIFVEPGE